MNNKLISVIILVFGFFSCDLFGGLSENDTPAPSVPTGAIRYLGRGYDVYANYADPLETRGVVLDFEKLYLDGLVDELVLDRSSFDIVEGSGLSEYQSALSSKTSLGGAFRGFSGSVKVNFDSSHYSLDEYSFATVRSMIQKSNVMIETGTSVETLKAYLSDNAKDYLNDPAITPLLVFQTFGTHVLQDIILGGRLDYNVSVDMSTLNTSQSIGVFAQASYSNIFASADVSSQVESSTALNTFESNKRKSLKIYGGLSEYGQFIINEDDQGYTPWIESISENPVFCDYAGNFPLIPIWEFCDDPERAQELEDYLLSYETLNAITVSAVSHNAITEIKLIRQGSFYEGPNPTSDGFYVIPQDLNEGASGDFIFLAYKYGSDLDEDPITGIHVVNSDWGERELPGYIRPSGFCDLNSGAGGDYIYLYYSRGGSNIIRGIGTRNLDGKHYFSTVSGPVYNDAGGRNFIWDGHDLNAEAGGDYLYLGWSYDLVD